MKANVFEIKRFAVHDGDGIRTTVFFKGCPLSCLWCHNPEGIGFSPELAYYSHKCVRCGECVSVCPNGAHKIDGTGHVFDRSLCNACGKCAEVCLGAALTLYGRGMTVDELLPLLLEDHDFYESSGGGVTLSGGECLMQWQFCLELAKRLRAEGISCAIDTSGYVKREVLDELIPYVDIFLYDLKAIDEETHVKCTGHSNAVILENMKYLSERGAKIEVRIPFVPDYNSADIEKMAELLENIETLTKVRVLPYHSYASTKYSALGMKNTLPETIPTDEDIKAAKETLRAHGIRVQD
jgi:pyruvate formate lyase activating enzyme